MRNIALTTLIAGLTALSCLYVQTRAVSADEKHIKFVGTPFKPYYFVNDRQQVDGLAIERFSKIVQHAGLTWTGSLVPPRRLRHMIETGDADVAMHSAHEYRAGSDKTLYGTEIITSVKLNIYSHEQVPAASTLDDLKGKRVLAIAEYNYGNIREWLEDPMNKVHLIDVDRFDQAIKMLSSNRADYLLLYEANFEEALIGMKDKYEDIKATVHSHVPVYFVVSQNGSFDARDLLSQLEASYREIRDPFNAEQ